MSIQSGGALPARSAPPQLRNEQRGKRMPTEMAKKLASQSTPVQTLSNGDPGDEVC